MRPPGGLKSFMSLLTKHFERQAGEVGSKVASTHLHLLLTVEEGRVG